MSKQALKAGLKAYPEDIIGTTQTPLDKNAPVDANVGKRIYFMEGYKQAEKDTIERAVSWLKEIDNGTEIFDIDAFIMAFRRDMEEE